MAQPTESDILAALGRYRAYIAEANHRAMLLIIPVVETARIEKLDAGVSAEEEEEARSDYLNRLIDIPRGNTQPPIERPSDVLEHWDLIVQQVSLDGTAVNADPEWRTTKRETYRSAILEGLRRLECPTGQWALPHDFEILMQHVDGLQGHGWSMLRDITERLIFWEGWGPEAILETAEQIQQRVMSGQAILDETNRLYEHDNYYIAGGWRSGVGNESNVYVVYSRPTEDEGQGWAWRYVVTMGQFGIEFFDDIVAVLDWYKYKDEPLEIEWEVTAEDVFSV